MRRRSGWIHLLVLTFAAAISSLSSTSAEVPADAADFNGFWMPNVGQSTRWPYDNPPYTEHGRALWDAYAAEFDTDVDDPSRICVPEAMPRSMIEPPFPVEIIQREHDITMFFEAWSMYRKIHMVGSRHAPAVLHSRMGYAVAHWEGDTLVVETTHLRERTMGKIMMSDEARMEERMRIETHEDGRKQLVNDVTFFDEQVYTEPVTMRGVWDYAPDSPVLEYVCAEELWEQYVETLRDQGVRVF